MWFLKYIPSKPCGRWDALALSRETRGWPELSSTKSLNSVELSPALREESGRFILTRKTLQSVDILIIIEREVHKSMREGNIRI